MQRNWSSWPRFTAALAALTSLAGPASAQVFTVQIGAAPLPPTTLINHFDVWRHRPGTNAPQSGWQVLPEAELDATWRTGPGGFGYSTDTASETSRCRTVLADMLNRYTTYYIRRSFEITEPVDPSRRLQLVVDYDDGFVAWLDGVEVARSSNAPGAPGSEPAYNAVSLPPNHESSLGTAGNPPLTNDLGLVGHRLQPGTHVLALLGLNGSANSSDFILVPDLRLVGGQGAATEGAFFTLVRSNVVTLSGSNTLAGATRVTVNGLEAAFDPVTGIWSRTHSLVAGWNEVFIAALDAQGRILAATNKAVVAELATVSVGGVLTGHTTWLANQGLVRVTNTLVVPAGVQLTIGPGVVVLLSPGASLVATTNGLVGALGTEASPVYFLPADGTTAWGEISARGANASVLLRRAELVAGQVIAHPEASVTVEDSLLRDFRAGSRLFLAATNAQQFSLRRSHVTRYDQVRFSGTPVQIEDCLFEHIGSDATDLADHADIQVRRATYRFGAGSNTDALDLGHNPGMLIEQCLIRDLPDKGISIAQSPGVVVQGCLIYNCGIGIATYAASNCVFNQNTIARSGTGLSLYSRAGFPGPGQATASNHIVWGNATNIHLAGGGALDLSFSDVEGGWPGAGNFGSDPRFVDPDRGDFRLAPDSPARGAGLGGVDLGAVFPVGGIPPAPFHLAAHAAGTNAVQIWWAEDADNEAGFELQRSPDSTNWSLLAALGPNETNWVDATAALEQPYFYRVRATNASGFSRFSNVGRAVRRAPLLLLGGTLTNNTLLSPGLGEVVVYSSVRVPTNITLTIEAGTVLRLTNGASLRAVQGGRVEVLGTEAQPVRFQRLGAGLWGELSAQFGASLTIRHADISGGQVTVYSNAVLVLEDSYLHDYRVTSGATLWNQPLVLAHYAQPTTIRRCIFREYYELLLRNGRHLLEDCLFENVYGDALDFDTAHAGTVVRRCTFRHGNSGNIDAVDVGPDSASSTGVVIEDCLMYDFPFDKGVSIGEDSFDITVRNCFMHHVARGVQVKDVSTASVYDCTIVHAEIGLHGYEKPPRVGGGRLTNTFNNILWNVTNAIVIETNSTIVVNYSNLQNTNWPGTGNLSADPQFVNLAELDCRLRLASPCRGSGRDGTDMGARLPVGAPMAPSNPSLDVADLATADDGATVVRLRFWADSERSYSLQASDQADGGAWTTLTNVFPETLPRRITLNQPVAGGASHFYRLVTPAQP